MTTVAATADTSPDHKSISSGITFLLAISCGLIVANLYYAQPLVGPVSRELGLSPQAAGLVVTMTQMGYSIGLLLIVPISDLLENRRLVLIMMGLGCLAQLATAFAMQPLQFLAAGAFAGLGSVSVQLLMLYAAHLAPEASRGRVVGNVSGGLMLGILLARPIASFITAISSWHVVFVFAALVMAALFVVLGRAFRNASPRRACATANCSPRWGACWSRPPSCKDERSTRPVFFAPFACLDRHSLGTGRTAFSSVASRHRSLRPCRCGRRDCGANCRPDRRSGMEPPGNGCGDCRRSHCLPDDPCRPGRLDAVARLHGRGRNSRRSRGSGECRSRLQSHFALGAEYRGRLDGLYM